MFLDIAGESADAFPPLKSCFGCINALIKHYDVGFYRTIGPALLIYLSQQSKDIEDKIESLIPWLTRLKDCMTKPSAGGIHEEAERREQLTRSASHLHCLAYPS